MSADQVDDVEHAEDRLHSMAEALRDLLRALDEGKPAAASACRVRGLDRLREYDAEYCRPTCEGQEAEHGTEGHEDSCGCPGHE